jgi:hypothetical protein
VVAHGGDLERFGLARLSAMLYRRMDDADDGTGGGGGGDRGGAVGSSCCVAADAGHFVDLAVRLATNQSRLCSCIIIGEDQ